MSLINCPECKSLLNNDEKASGKCFDCGATFSSSLPEPKSSSSFSLNSRENTICGILKVIGILILIFGTIGSICLATQEYKFELEKFIFPEIGTIISGMMFIGFSEIIQLLQDIKNKLE